MKRPSCVWSRRCWLKPAKNGNPEKSTSTWKAKPSPQFELAEFTGKNCAANCALFRDITVSERVSALPSTPAVIWVRLDGATAHAQESIQVNFADWILLKKQVRIRTIPFGIGFQAAQQFEAGLSERIAIKPAPQG